MAMSASPTTTETPADRVLTLTRVFDAPRHVVFEMWTKGEHLAMWCAPAGFTIPESEGDIRPGGKWSSCMRSPQGDEYRLGGVYRDIVEDEFVSFTHAWEEETGSGPETLVTVRFADFEGKTMLTFEQGVFSSRESRDSHHGGWSQCFDRLDEYLGTITRQ